MGTNSVYLIPRESAMTASEWSAKVREVLVKMGVVEFGDDSDPSNFGNGEHADSAFESGGVEEDEPGPFDFGFVHQYPGAVFLPEPYAETPMCPHCGSEVKADVAALRWDEDGNEREIDMRELRITCPKCARVMRLDDLKDDFGTKFYLSDRFVEFSDARMPREEWLKEFNARMGVEHDVLEYGYT